MSIEPHYEFRKDMDMIHKPDRRDFQATPGKDETVIDDSWQLVIPANANEVLLTAVEDLQDYFAVSMKITLQITTDAAAEKRIEFVQDKDFKCAPRGYSFVVTDSSVVIKGNTSEGLGQGCYYIEDLMNLRQAPFLTRCDILREPVFAPRMVHSGWSIDKFPDSHLNAIAHAGFDSILLFVTGPNKTTHGDIDFNDLVDRSAKYGLGVYFYSYLDSFKHPDEPDAEEFFDNSYGAVFKACPRAKGLILVGESCNFPTKDPRANPRNPRNCKPEEVSPDGQYDGNIDYRHHSGWFPCKDYPQWLNAVKKAVYKYSPDADIVFWTYNWGRVESEPRIELINELPTDVSLQATFEMFDIIKKYPNFQTVQPDYSITHPGPGEYFSSEAKAAGKRNLRLYTMANTAGRTWDFGTVPYVPVPQQWCKRYNQMLKAHELYGLCGVMDSHHYGWYPSEISEYSKWNFWTPAIDQEDILYKMAVRDFGKDAAADIVKGWELWSRAIDSYTPGFEDQAGPLRVGPSYPLLFLPCLYPHFEPSLKYPAPPESLVGSRWITPNYYPEHIYNMSFSGRKLPEDIKIISAALDIWEEGNKIMLDALKKVPAEKLERASKAVGVGVYCSCAIHTMLNTKKWYLLNRKLEIEYDFAAAEKMVDELEAIIADEEINVQRALPLLEADSRLGWEPSMDYIGSAWHIRRKLHHLSVLKERTLPAYRKTLCKNPVMFYAKN